MAHPKFGHTVTHCEDQYILRLEVVDFQAFQR